MKQGRYKYILEKRKRKRERKIILKGKKEGKKNHYKREKNKR